MKANVVGDLLDDNILIKSQAASGTTPIVSDVCQLQNLDGASFILVTGVVTGTWLIEASNNYVSSTFPNMNQGAQVGSAKWADVTAMFHVPAGTAIVNPTGTAITQYCQAHPFVGAALRVTFTPSSGSGTVAAYYSGKGNR